MEYGRKHTDGGGGGGGGGQERAMQGKGGDGKTQREREFLRVL